jgi:phenylacetate-coenzyme A ligase PaaK-like adenylate-forming protein
MISASPAVLVQRLGQAAEEAAMLARFTRDLPGFLRSPLSVEEAHRRIRARLANRERMFLSSVKRTIYQHPRSPYLRLLRHVGCEHGDLERLVRQDGIDGALASLAARGVYVTFDELKGRREAVRGSACFTFSPRDFDSPLYRPHYATYTGGSRGQPVRVPRHFQYVEELASAKAASLAAFGITRAQHVYWLTNPLTAMLHAKKLGADARLWAQPLRTFPKKGLLVARYLELMGRLVGSPFPRPRLLEADRADLMARWLHHQRQDGQDWVVDTIPSSAVRIALAAQEHGVRLDGVTFALQSEPVTDARHRHIVDSGARALVFYTSIEMSNIASSCATASVADDLHAFTDRYALIERARPIVDGGPEVRALMLTTLTDTVATVSFNTEPGDYANVEQRQCGCGLGELGLTTHLSRVRSFEKLSGEGVTFARSNLMRTLEEVLPARFGGSALDYQLVEDEAPDSLVRLTLRVHPSVGDLDEEAVREALLADLGGGGIVDRNHAELLRRAGSVIISREPPLATAAGKVLPFQLVRGGSPGPSSVSVGTR